MSNPLRWLAQAPSFVIEVGKRWYYGGIGDLAAGVTFWILLTLPAAILALGSALGQLESVIGADAVDSVRLDVIDFSEQVLGSRSDSITSTVDELFRNQNSGLLTFSLAVSFWTISRGFAGMIRALDGVYEVEDGRAWYYTRVVALVLGLGSLLVSVPIIVLESFVWSRIDWPIEGGLRFISALAILVFWASMLFHFGPSIRTKWRWDFPGAIVAGLLWWALTEGFRYYVNLTQGRNAALTAIGAALLALTWVWLAAQVLLIGAAVNTELGRRMGLDRHKRDWKVSEAINNTTGQIKKIVVPDARPTDPRNGRANGAGRRSPRRENQPRRARARAESETPSASPRPAPQAPAAQQSAPPQAAPPRTGQKPEPVPDRVTESSIWPDAPTE